ncbi:ELP2 [Branchiostoma lanceolatum]|uniref:Elongator complex protein 2 n=1 Tax=Branchiostoma lanceolatum TaxID=7740 RepID=A0A8K0EBD7_BRALA|nr:ELP2 [Branchiostoma lanceolatum]
MAAHGGVETCFISAACNRSPFSLSWGRNGLVLYGSGNLVAVYQPKNGDESGSVLQTLSQHTAKVTCVRWIPKGNGEPSDEFVVGSADKTASLWRRHESKFKVMSVLRGHSAAVTIAEAMYVPTSNKDEFFTLLATSSVDSTVRIWEKKQGSDEVTCLQTVSCGNSFALDLALYTLPTTSVPVLACGWDDDRIHLWVRQGEGFREVATLKGHEDWVRGVEFTANDDGDLLLASCGQDCFIRVWKITLQHGEEQVAEDEIRVKEKSFTIQHGDKSQSYAVVLEAVLSGHENWIYGVHWQPAVFNDGSRHQPLCLLSASMDKTMILWKPDPGSGIWLDQDRVGEVGGNTLGFLGCQFSPDGQSIIAHGFQGALHLWHHVELTQQTSWEPGVTVGGHFDGVEDIAWDPDGGEFLLSVSLDRTTRLFAPWRREGLKPQWHELGRPQIHGYAINCLAMVNRYQFVSGGDEKVLRVFDAPKNFLQNLKNVSGVDISKDMVAREVSNVPEGASVPALGLSNKALYEGEMTVADDADREIPSSFSEQYPQMYYQPLELHRPPTEEHLLQNTLWPETQKLYGHGYELFCVACNRQGTLVASACKASKAEHAAILLWDTTSWRQVGCLESHSLTVTQLRFSHSGHLLLSVSRDRTWALFRRQAADQADGGLFTRIACTDKKTSVHSRIIWGCSWSHDDNFFATASRDKKVVVWGWRPDHSPAEGCLGECCARSTTLDVGEAATAVDFAPVLAGSKGYCLAIGKESGTVVLYYWNPAGGKEDWTLQTTIDKSDLGHCLAVRRLAWRPASWNAESEERNKYLQLASCGDDFTMRIFNISVDILT